MGWLGDNKKWFSTFVWVWVPPPLVSHFVLLSAVPLCAHLFFLLHINIATGVCARVFDTQHIQIMLKLQRMCAHGE